jgi:putative phage-type endonuclease
MIIDNCAQGSPEWLACRVGLPTASNFDKLVTTKGEQSKQRQKYLYTLAGERLIGKKEETYQNGAMQRGIEMEVEARSFYEMNKNVDVVQVGICYPDKKKLYGASPDGLVGDDGILEVKCPILSTMVGYMIDGKLGVDYLQQVQGQMLVTGRKWVDLLAYYPGITPIIERIERDEPFIKALKAELVLFVHELGIITEKLRGVK